MHILIAEGYLWAARLVVANRHQKPWSQDTFFYPMLYLYRHHIELMMKRCLIEARSILRQRNKAAAEEGHDLTKLWNALRDRFSRLPPPQRLMDGNVLKGVSKQINDLHGHDPFAIGGRYSTGRDGKSPLFNLDEASMLHFQQVIERLVTYFREMLAWLMEEHESRISLPGQ